MEKAALANGKIPVDKNYSRLIFQDNPNSIGKEINKIQFCGNVVQSITCTQCGERYFKGYHRCKSKYCPTCAKLKSYIWAAHLMKYFDGWLNNNRKIFFANFTVPNTENLKDALTTINNAWRYMTNKLVPKEWKKRFDGGLRSLEIKKGSKQGLWHPHLLVVLILRQKLNV